MNPQAAVEPAREGRPLTGAKVLLLLVAFFGVVFAVNGMMIRYAITTFPGLEDAQAYERGLTYDREIAAAHRQSALGWSAVGSVSRAAEGAAEVSLSLRDRNGIPVSGLAVDAVLESPSDRKVDHRLNLLEAAPGEYRGFVQANEGGWTLDLTAKRDGEQVFRTRNRVLLK